MKNLIVNVSKETRMVSLPKQFIAVDGENLQNKLVFTFIDEFVNGQGRLEYEIKGEKSYVTLNKENDAYEIPVKNVMTKEGQIDMQLVIAEGTDEEETPVFKSNKFYLYCNASINAVDEAPAGYDLWIETANAKLNQVDNLDIDIEDRVVTVTKKDGTQKSVEIEAIPNVLEIGSVVTGEIAEATITGEAPNQILNLVLPKGDAGADFTYDMFTEEQLENLKGKDGTDGKDGIDGVSPLITATQTETGATITITDKNGTTSANLTNGKNGVDGKDGIDGVSPTITATQTNSGATITIKDKNGTTTANLINGKDGKDGEKGEAFTYEDFTEEQLAALRGKDGADGTNGKDGNGISSITRYYLATNKISGSKVIEWDGDTTGKEVIDLFYKVSDEVFTMEELIGQKVEIISGGEITEMTIGDCNGTNDGYFTATPEGFGTGVIRVVRQTTDDMPFPVGTYFLSYMGAMYVSKLTVVGGGIGTDEEGWTTEVQTIDPTNKYLWSYEVVEFTDGTNNTSEPAIIGVYGDKGADGQTPDMSTYYTKEETNTAIANAIGTVLEGSY